MKKQIIILLFGLMFNGLYAQNNAYVQGMKDAIEDMNKAEDFSAMQTCANTFERIAEAEKDKWLPYYYAAYCNALVCFMGLEADKTDQQLDLAEKQLKKARELSPENDEIEVVQGFIEQGRIQVDPQSRGYEYSTRANAAFNKAKAINADNPRIYFLLGQNLLYTPEAFGGGKATACPLFEKAKEKFMNFTPQSEIAPNWGEEMTNELIKVCNNN